MAAQEQNEYVLGTHDEELARLGFQHRIWGEQAFAIWERAGFAPGQTILDVGCGPGFGTLDLSRIVTQTGRVIAVDASKRYLDHMKAQIEAQRLTNVETRLTDVHDIDLEPGSVDGAYARWVLCFVRDPAAVIASVAGALRPGGVFAVQDYFNYEAIALAPRSAIFQRTIRAVVPRWRDTGGDPDLAGRLPGFFRASGMEVREIRGITRVARAGSALWNWPTTFFQNFLPTLVEAGLITAEEHREFNEEWSRRSADPDTFFCSPLVYDVIATKLK
jgi:ubiquinone/menaquinone biosynthesis C-methylase UbiE